MPEADERSASYPARDHYRRERAAHYERDRTLSAGNRRKWRAEEATLDRMLASLPPGTRVLDLPCGTGRFFELFDRHGIARVGADISLDMLAQIPPELRATSAHQGLVVCEAEHLPFREGSFDYTVSIRFFNLLPDEVVERVTAELARVGRKGQIVQVRFRGEGLLVDPFLRWLRRWLDHLRGALRRLRPGRSGETAVRRSKVKRTFRPKSPRAFRAMVASRGLRIARRRLVGMPRALLHPDRLNLCLLVPRAEGRRGR